MEEPIDKYKFKLTTFSCELDGPLNKDCRTIILTEAEIYETSLQDNNCGDYNQVYKAKVVGATQVSQFEKIVKGKSRRGQSKKIRQMCYGDIPDESYYEWFTNGIMEHYEEIKQFVEDKKGAYE